MKLFIYFFTRINAYIKDERSKRQFKNIVYSFVFKGASIICSFLMVPLTLKFLDVTSYGIWLTITSIVSWINFLDGGLGNGLKNKLSESIALGDTKKSRTYIASTYGGIIFIVILILIIFFGTSFFVNWASILKAPVAISKDVIVAISIVFVCFGLRLIMDLINTILIANQKVGTASIINFIINVVLLIGMFIITKFVVFHKLIYFSLFLCISPLVILGLFTGYFFLNDYKNLRPSLSFFNRKVLKDILSLGIKFFVIQIAVIIIFSTDNLIITRLFSPADVTIYNVAFKYFNVLTFAWTLIISPYWVAFNEAYIKEDFVWIKKTINTLEKTWLIFSLLVVIAFFLANTLYELWIGKSVIVPQNLSLLMGLFVLISSLTNLYIYFINGIGKIKLQFWISIFAAAINLPLCFYLAGNLGFGINGIIISTCISVFPSLVLSRMQYLKIINNKINKPLQTSSIWLK